MYHYNYCDKRVYDKRRFPPHMSAHCTCLVYKNLVHLYTRSSTKDRVAANGFDEIGAVVPMDE